MIQTAVSVDPVDVALYTSAWIEITPYPHPPWHRNCRTLHECVDWNHPIGRHVKLELVALLVSAWIEITRTIEWLGNGNVALLVSAWIEIAIIRCKAMLLIVALLVSAWIEIWTGSVTSLEIDVALLVSAWIEIEHLRSMYLCLYSRTPRECVDWNSDERKQPFFITSHTSWVRGLKSHHKSERSWWRWSHSLWVRGLKLAYFIRQLQLFWFTWEHNLLLDYVPVCNAFVLFYYTLQNK